MKTYRSARVAAAAGITGLLLTFSAATIHADPMTVSANVAASCALGTVAPMTFTPPTENTSTTIEYQCTLDTGAQIEVDLGSLEFPVASGQRNMDDDTTSTVLLPYNLWQDAGFNTPWGSRAAGDGFGVTGTGMDDFDSVTVYATVPANAYDLLLPDNYQDSVDVTISINP